MTCMQCHCDFFGGLNGLNGLNESSLIWDLRVGQRRETRLDSHQEAQEFRSVAANARQVAQARSQERAMQAGNLTASALLPADRNPSARGPLLSLIQVIGLVINLIKQ